MELAGSGYLYTVAVIATTFAGFTGLTMIFRQSLGGRMSKLDAFVIRIFVQLGFLATVGALLPPLLALFDLSTATVWRAASAIIGVVLGCWTVTFPRRRHNASPIKVPHPIWAVIGMFGLTVLALAANAIVPRSDIVVGVYAAAVTAILVGGGMIFLFSLIYLFDRPIEASQPQPKS